MSQTTDPHAVPRILLYRREQLLEALGVSQSTLRRWMLHEGFPRPRQLGPRVVGWNVEECHDWLAARPRASYRGE
jgi:prophage regulatory protein